MKIAINAGETFDKITSAFRIKMFKKIRIDGNILSIINGHKNMKDMCMC
jgi:hypothetical protein